MFLTITASGGVADGSPLPDCPATLPTDRESRCPWTRVAPRDLGRRAPRRTDDRSCQPAVQGV